MEAAASSETLVTLPQSAWRHIPEVSNLQIKYAFQTSRSSETAFRCEIKQNLTFVCVCYIGFEYSELGLYGFI
jgi:hypothetical protein